MMKCECRRRNNYMKKNESTREIHCRQKRTGGTWKEINENAEKLKRKIDLKKSENMKRKMFKKVRTDRN